jgi:hypothetical protein
MMRMLIVAATCVVVGVNTSVAQSPAPGDSAGPNEVTAVSIKSGKLALSSAANPGPVFLPDGAYTNTGNTVIVVLDGRIIRVEYGSGSISQVASMRVQNQRVMLTPPVVALMSVSPFPLPSGTFTTQDGAHWFKVMSARPIEFVIRSGSP